MYLLSSAQQGSDPLFSFTTLLGTKPMTYGKFAVFLISFTLVYIVYN